MNRFTSSPRWWMAVGMVLFCISHVHASHSELSTRDYMKAFLPPYLTLTLTYDYDYGDAPSSYGSASHRKEFGLSLGYLVDAENGSFYSSDAEGDDADNQDDEDGVMFINIDGNCVGNPGSVQEVEVTVKQTILNDAYLTAWIDFDGNGSFDSDEKIVDNHTFYNHPNAQFLTISYGIPADAQTGATYARFRLDNGPISHPSSQDGKGEVEDYQIEICGSSETNEGWDYLCADEVEVELIGKGMVGQYTKTISFPDPSTVDSFIVVAVSKNGTPPASVDFSTDNGQNATVSAVATSNAPGGQTCSSCRVYEYRFDAASSVSINTGGNKNVQSIHVYLFRTVDAGANSAAAFPLNEYFYKGTNTFTLPLETADDPRTLTIQVPVSEMTDDARIIRLSVSAGGVSTTVEYNTYSLGQSFLIAEAVLNNVPGTADEVVIEIKSPSSNGDSFVVGGYVTLSSECDASTDFGDAPASYGSASADIDAGVSLGASVDGEPGDLFSADADGDDMAGNDDEDGVTFEAVMAGCNGEPGTTQSLEIVALQSVWSDMFINAWIDFNNDGDFDANERIIENEPVYNNANPQLFSFDYAIPADAVVGSTFARFRLTNSQTSSATGHVTNGGEVEDYPFTICGEMPTADSYFYDCAEGVIVDVIGKGIKGQSNATLDITDLASVDSLVVVAVSKNGTPPTEVTFSTNNGQSEVAPAQTISNAPNGNTCSTCRVYKASFDPASQVEIDFAGQTQIYSFVAYIFRDADADGGSAYGVTVDQYFFKGDDSYTIPIQTEASSRDLTLTIPVSEMTDDSRIIEVKATAGAVTETVIYDDYDPALGESLRLITIVLEDVPGSVDEVSVVIKSPSSNGDSFVIGGYINVESNCGSTYDYGDAPLSYGEAGVEVLDGMRMGSSVDVEPGNQYSADADGDDNDGNDDEDGVTFVNAQGSCTIFAGGDQQVEITVLQSVLNTTYLNGWIDYDGNGTFDSDERIIDNFFVGNSGSLQTFTFDYTVPNNPALGMTFARFWFSDEQISSPTGTSTNGGEVEDYQIEICNPFTPPLTFVSNCEDGLEVDLYGIGLEDNTTGGTINIPNSGNVDSIIVIAVHKGGGVPSTVTFTTNNGQNVSTPDQPVSNAPGGNTCSNCKYYIARLNPASSVFVDTDGNDNIQSAVAYVFRSGTPNQYSYSGLLVAEYYFKGDNTYVLPLNSAAGPRNIRIELPLSDMENDSRVINLTATAGGVSTFEAHNTFDADKGSSLDIVGLDLIDVPGSATSIEIEIESPDNNGESAVLAGYISVRSDCVDVDYGDAPASYQEVGHVIVDGLRLGNQIDSELAPKYSQNGDGDDGSGIDDEDGVVFTAQQESCFGTAGNTEQLFVKVFNSEYFDVFLSGWIDFNGDGDFDSDEKVIDSYEINNSGEPQNFVFDYTIPVDAFVGQTYARFRIGSDPIESPFGIETEGEVEDYVCFIAAAVPVELIRFEATEVNGKVLLSWATETELNNRGFEVEKSVDGQNWQVIGWVDGAGTTLLPQAYELLDEAPVAGNNYYRLRQVDFDGAFEYSPIEIIRMDAVVNGSMLVYPNPFTERLNVRLPVAPATGAATTLTLRLYNMAGVVQRVWEVPTAQQLDVELQGIPAGTYLLDVEVDGYHYRNTIVKMNK